MTDDLAAALAAINSRLDGLGELGQRMAAIEDRIGSLERISRQARSDVMARFDRLQADLSNDRDELLVTFATVDRLENTVRPTAEQVSIMFRMLHKLVARVSALEEKS